MPATYTERERNVAVPERPTGALPAMRSKKNLRKMRRPVKKELLKRKKPRKSPWKTTRKCCKKRKQPSMLLQAKLPKQICLLSKGSPSSRRRKRKRTTLFP